MGRSTCSQLRSFRISPTVTNKRLTPSPATRCARCESLKRRRKVGTDLIATDLCLIQLALALNETLIEKERELSNIQSQIDDMIEFAVCGFHRRLRLLSLFSYTFRNDVSNSTRRSNSFAHKSLRLKKKTSKVPSTTKSMLAFVLIMSTEIEVEKAKLLQDKLKFQKQAVASIRELNLQAALV